MNNKLYFFLSRMKEKLWVKPFIICCLSVIAALLACWSDSIVNYYEIKWIIPEIKQESIEELLKITAGSMLIISTFAVGSMVSAYASTANTATPRAFPLVVADDMTQNALSVFIGSFIYSMVALIAIMNEYYLNAGRFVIFCSTLLMLAIVVITFLRWVDKLARLGRLGTTIDKVERATQLSMKTRRKRPYLGGTVSKNHGNKIGVHIYSTSVGYIQNIDMNHLQKYAEDNSVHIKVFALPGIFVGPGRPIAIVFSDSDQPIEVESSQILKGFTIGQDRVFDQDPRFGLVVLSEIAIRALSPAVNDPGTAIDVINTMVRLLTSWVEPIDEEDIETCLYNRIEVPDLLLKDLFDDAFSAIARDSASMIEVQLRLQKAYKMLFLTENNDMKTVVAHHAREALLRAEQSTLLPEELNALKTQVQSFL